MEAYKSEIANSKVGEFNMDNFNLLVSMNKQQKLELKLLRDNILLLDKKSHQKLEDQKAS